MTKKEMQEKQKEEKEGQWKIERKNEKEKKNIAIMLGLRKSS